MKRILNLSTLLLVAMSAMFLYSCSDEPGDTPVNVPPVVTLTSSDAITVDPAGTFTIDFSASKGSDSPLKAVTVYEAGTKMPASRLTINGSAAAANAILIVGDDKEDGITWSIDIVAQSTAASTVTFEVEVQDDAGGKNSVFVDVTTVGTPPTLTTTSPMIITTDQDIKNLFRLTAAKGTGDLVSIEVTQAGTFVDASNIFWKVITMAVDENPFFLAEEDKAGFTNQELYIMTPEIEGNFVYKVVLTDEFGLTAELTFDVTTLPNGTPIEMRTDVALDRLFNAGGDQGTGGLDLDNGMSTNSDDPEAEIKDNGLDDTLPPGDNWFRTISPITENGVSMKYLIANQGGLPEGFTFASIEFKEDLPDLFNNGVDFVNGESEIVQIEDVFIVTRDGKYWVLEVVEIVSDPNNNIDSYKFDVKF